MYASFRRYRMGAGSIDDAMHLADTEFADRLLSSWASSNTRSSPWATTWSCI